MEDKINEVGQAGAENRDEQPSMASMGGKASAAKMTAAQRRQRARDAAEARWGAKYPRALKEGILTIGDQKIPCSVLEGEIRVLSEREFTKTLGGKRGGSHWKR